MNGGLCTSLPPEQATTKIFSPFSTLGSLITRIYPFFLPIFDDLSFKVYHVSPTLNIFCVY
jgi:hypothetical protein